MRALKNLQSKALVKVFSSVSQNHPKSFFLYKFVFFFFPCWAAVVRCVLVVTCGSTSNQSSIAITLASAGLINYFVWWILSLIFLRFEGLTSHRSWGRGVFSLKTSVTTLCSQQSGALATPECLCMVSDLISQPRVIFGRIVGSALIRSRVCIMASTLWIPYCSRTAPHFRSWTWTKRYTTEIPNINTGWRKPSTCTETHTELVPCLRAVGGGRRTELLWWCHRGCGSKPFYRWSEHWPHPGLSVPGGSDQLPVTHSLLSASRISLIYLPSLCSSLHLLSSSVLLQLTCGWMCVFWHGARGAWGKVWIPKEGDRVWFQVNSVRRKAYKCLLNRQYSIQELGGKM